MCKKELPKTHEFFAQRRIGKDGQIIFNSNCRVCHSEYRKDHYNRNKDKYIKKARSYGKKVSNWLDEYKNTLKCIKCGESRGWVLDFHHIDPKTKGKDISILKGDASKKKILEEMKKCIVLCSNCHRDLHYQEKINAK